jgi:cytidyltransferase-like protein
MRVLIAGTFDLFHKGHEFFIASALQYVAEVRNSEFHVIIATDVNVEKIKNKIPKNSENQRKNNVEKFIKNKIVENLNIYKNIKIFVHIGSETNFLKLPIKINPDIICVGYDQKIPKSLLLEKEKGFLKNCKFVVCDSYFPEKYKTSLVDI